MNTDQWVDLLKTIITTIGVIASGAGVAALVSKNRPSKADTLTARVESCESRLNVATDYMHVLRGEIVTLGGTPSPWPAELTNR